MLERIRFRGMDLASLRTMQQAGGAMNPARIALYADHMDRKGGSLFVMYGQTEATARIAYVPPDRLADKLGSAGIAIPGGRLSIDQDGALESDGRPLGEVVYEGPNVMLGYADRLEDLAAGDELHGILRTGDIGYLDADGFLYLAGRRKRIAKVFGVRINLDEVEMMLREWGPAVVVANDDLIWGFCEFGTDESLADLRETMSLRLRLRRSALNLRRVWDIPVHASGKPDYRQVERWIEG
jgi:acyl-CoA synthetase (AMP-forming)/AMP-acid ligase II